MQHPAPRFESGLRQGSSSRPAPLSSCRIAFLRCALVGWMFAAFCPSAAAQGPTLIVDVRGPSGPVAGADVTVNGISLEADAQGRAVATVPPGRADMLVVADGYAPVNASVQVAAGAAQHVIVQLVHEVTVEEEVTVSATRTGRRLEDQPMRVEVLAREEIEEKMLMTPGDIVMMLNEMGGMRVHATSPSLGAASVRIQGMPGRYTRFLSDGLPLFGEQVGALGLLQIPPMDLGQVEVIKGVASSLYGAGALGGVVNLISRRPGPEPVRELLVNRSSRGGTDAVGFYASPLSPQWGVTLLAGGHWQERTDVNDDGWSDLPGYARGVFRPRLFWEGGGGRHVFATAGVTVEDREGGTMPGGGVGADDATHVEALATRRMDGGIVAQTTWRGQYVVTGRAAMAQQRHEHRFGEVLERDHHDTAFGEVAIRGSAGPHTWIAGVAIEYDAYRPRDLPHFAYSFTVPGIFVQDDVDVTGWLSLSASGRVDRHSEYGTFFSPRIATLLRAGRWSSRLSVGAGFFGPSPLTEETETAGLSRLVVPRALRAERGRSASLDVTRTDGPLSYTFTLFSSRVRHPIDVERTSGLRLVNAAEPATNAGVELLATLRREPFAVTGTYTYVQSREAEDGRRVQAALTPGHSAGLVGIWEREEAGRVGVEIYYTGVQRLEDNPFATRSEPYVILGLLAERQLGPVRLFVNGENLTDTRQTRWHPLVRPERAPDGRWTVDAWAPLEGRTVNGGIRLRF